MPSHSEAIKWLIHWFRIQSFSKNHQVETRSLIHELFGNISDLLSEHPMYKESISSLSERLAPIQ
jgi:hypothetical protein